MFLLAIEILLGMIRVFTQTVFALALPWRSFSPWSCTLCIVSTPKFAGMSGKELSDLAIHSNWAHHHILDSHEPDRVLFEPDDGAS